MSEINLARGGKRQAFDNEEKSSDEQISAALDEIHIFLS
jgi:hypothetical protein